MAEEEAPPPVEPASPDGSLPGDPAPSHPGVIAPPPLIYLGFLLVGLGLNGLAPDWAIGGPPPLRWALGGVLGLIGVWLVVSALGLFRAAGTKPEPWKPATALVGAGVYRLSRNPMYLGMALIYLGLAMGFDSLFAAILLAPTLAVVQIGVIQREERYLEAKFGEPYRRYKSKVRPWL